MKVKQIGSTPFDGAKLMSRYGLNRSDFYVIGDLLHYPDTLPDDIIVEGPDAPKEKVKNKIGRLGGDPLLREILLDLAQEK